MILANEKYLYQQPAVKENVAPEGKRAVSRRRKPQAGTFYAGIVLIVFILALFLTTRYAQIAMTGYKAVELKKALATIEAENDHLNEEINRLKSLDRIEKIAINDLGMLKPNVDGIGYVAMDAKKKNSNVTGGVKDPAGGGETAQKEEENGLLRAFASLLANWQGKLSPAEAGEN